LDIAIPNLNKPELDYRPLNLEKV